MNNTIDNYINKHMGTFYLGSVNAAERNLPPPAHSPFANSLMNIQEISTSANRRPLPFTSDQTSFFTSNLSYPPNCNTSSGGPSPFLNLDYSIGLKISKDPNIFENYIQYKDNKSILNSSGNSDNEHVPSKPFDHLNESRKRLMVLPKNHFMMNKMIKTGESRNPIQSSSKKIISTKKYTNFIPLPKPTNKKKDNGKKENLNKPSTVVEEKKTAYQKVKSSERNLRIITGNIDRILKFKKSFPDLYALVEFYAKIINIRAGKHICEQIILLRNEVGPVLQAVYYEIDFKMPSVKVGDLVRCIGHFTKQENRLQLIKISQANDDFIESVMRLHTICNFTLNKHKEKGKFF